MELYVCREIEVNSAPEPARFSSLPIDIGEDEKETKMTQQHTDLEFLRGGGFMKTILLYYLSMLLTVADGTR